MPKTNEQGKQEVDMQQQAILKIVEERQRQDAKCGPQHHSPYEWLPILMEEVGEMSQQMWLVHTGRVHDLDPSNGYAKELIQVVAVGLAMLEDYFESNPHRLGLINSVKETKDANDD